MNLKALTDDQLIKATDKLVKSEREILSDILHHFKEIERRRLFSSLGYKSLFDYAVKKLGYSEDQAYRRIQAMRLFKELPQLEAKVNAGELNLSHLSLAKKLFKQEEISTPARKIEILNRLQNQPVREAQKIVFSISSQPQTFISEKQRQVTPHLTELRFVVTEETKRKIETVKGLLAHSNPNISMADLLDKLCDMAIAQKTAAFRKRCVTKPADKQALNAQNFGKCTVSTKCENCGSTYALERDHIIPKAKGGSNESENLRTLCRSCNQRAAIQEFGQTIMDIYIN